MATLESVKRQERRKRRRKREGIIRIPGRGIPKGNMIQISVCLDVDVLDEVRTMATKQNTGLSEQINRVLDWGLASLEEVDDELR